MRLAPSGAQAQAWTALSAFTRGPFLIYAGQEAAASHTPSLFDVDKISWQEYPLQPFLTALANLKKDPEVTSGKFMLVEDRDTIQAVWLTESGGLFGIFNVQNLSGKISIPLPDGTYQNVIDGSMVSVSGGKISALPAAILKYSEPVKFLSFQSSLF